MNIEELRANELCDGIDETLHETGTTISKVVERHIDRATSLCAVKEPVVLRKGFDSVHMIADLFRKSFS